MTLLDLDQQGTAYRLRGRWAGELFKTTSDKVIVPVDCLADEDEYEFIAAETDQWAKVIRTANVKAD
jgi:hypothetical protein